MKKEKLHENEKRGIFSKQASEFLEDIVNHAYAGADASLVAKIDRSKQEYVKPQGTNRRNMFQNAAIAVGALLPAVSYIGCVLLKASTIVTGIVMGISGVGSSLIFWRIFAAPAKIEHVDMALNAYVEIDRVKREEAKKRSRNEMNQLIKYIEKYEREQAAGHDITVDRKFAEWVQKFCLFASQSDDRELYYLKESLLDRLACMDICVYDELILKEDGTPDVPFDDYLIDAREDEIYHEIVCPLIYSNKGLLARGKVK